MSNLVQSKFVSNLVQLDRQEYVIDISQAGFEGKLYGIADETCHGQSDLDGQGHSHNGTDVCSDRLANGQPRRPDIGADIFTHSPPDSRVDELSDRHTDVTYAPTTALRTLMETLTTTKTMMVLTMTLFPDLLVSNDMLLHSQ